MCLLDFLVGCRAVSLPTRANPELPHCRRPTTKPRYETHYLLVPIGGKIVLNSVPETVNQIVNQIVHQIVHKIVNQIVHQIVQDIVTETVKEIVTEIVQKIVRKIVKQ